jgi:hypothetical protein
MNELIVILATVAVVVAVGAIIFFVRRRPRNLKIESYTKQWRELQKLCRNKTTWKQAVIEADDLLDKALKKSGVRGKSMGERLVKIQRNLTNNDGVWYGHKLRRQLDSEPDKALREAEVKKALLGIRQALKDLGALPNAK